MKKDLADTLGLRRQTPYMVKLDKLGFYNNLYGFEGQIESADPVEGTLEIIKILAKNWTPGDEATYLYDLAINILAKLENIDDKSLIKHIKETRERMIIYEKNHIKGDEGEHQKDDDNPN